MRGELDFWEYDELGYIIAGTPERVEQRVRELVTELRLGQLITCMHVGNLPEEVAAQNNHLFGTEVIPKLRDIWSEHEDRWTPTGQPATRCRAVPRRRTRHERTVHGRAVTRSTVGTFDVNVWTAGAGSPVVYLHGYERHPGGAPFLERLAERHLVYAPEQPGYGTSTGLTEVRDIFDLVLFYRSLIGGWGHEQRGRRRSLDRRHAGCRAGDRRPGARRQA